MNSIDFGTMLREARECAGWGKCELCQEIGWDYTQLYKIETGDGVVGIRTLEPLLRTIKKKIVLRTDDDSFEISMDDEDSAKVAAKSLREHYGFTMAKMAGKIGISVSTINRTENFYGATMRIFFLLSEKLDITITVE